MMKDTRLDFRGQVFYIGIDVHKKRWSVTIRLNRLELKTFSMNPSPKELYRHMTTNYPGGIYKSVYEAGFSGYWAHRELVQLGIDNIVTSPADVPTSNKERDRKRNPIDSRKLARELENGSLKAIYVPNNSEQSLRSLSRLRYQLIINQRRIKNRIKSFLDFQGIKTPRRSEMWHWSGAFIRWLEAVKFEHEYDREYLDFQIDDLRYQRKRLTKALQLMRNYCKENNLIKNIQSIAGVGLITAFTLYAELIDMKRFKNLDHIASFVGLVPSVDSSGEKQKVKGLTHRHSKYVRYLLIEAAWRAVRDDPAMTLAFNQLCQRMSKQRAIIRMAKKLVNRVRYVWLNKTPYVSAVIE